MPGYGCLQHMVFPFTTLRFVESPLCVHAPTDFPERLHPDCRSDLPPGPSSRSRATLISGMTWYRVTDHDILSLKYDFTRYMGIVKILLAPIEPMSFGRPRTDVSGCWIDNLTALATITAALSTGRAGIARPQDMVVVARPAVKGDRVLILLR